MKYWVVWNCEVSLNNLLSHVYACYTYQIGEMASQYKTLWLWTQTTISASFWRIKIVQAVVTVVVCGIKWGSGRADLYFASFSFFRYGWTVISNIIVYGVTWGLFDKTSGAAADNEVHPGDAASFIVRLYASWCMLYCFALSTAIFRVNKCLRHLNSKILTKKKIISRPMIITPSPKQRPLTIAIGWEGAQSGR